MQAVFEECGVPGGTQMTLLPWAIVGLAVYTVGYPAFVMSYILYRNRVLIMEDQLLRAKCVGNDRLTNPHAFDLRKRFSRSYFQFKPDYWFWFGAIIVRKFCIAATSILFNRNSTFQMAACLLVMFCAYGVHLACRPYMSPSEFETVLREHSEKAFSSTLHAKLRASIMSVESRGRKKARRNIMTPEGKVDRTAVLGLLGGWLFNYNTVEAIILWSAVIVCLMGLMFDALTRGYASDYAERGRDSVTSVVLGVIIGSIIYFAGVLFTEAYVLYTEDQREKAMRSAAARKSGKKLPIGDSPSRRSVNVAPPSGLAKGSIYERSRSGGGFNTGALEQSFNPLALSAGEGGLGIDAGSMKVVDSVAGMSAPPPQDVWAVFQSAFKEMHQQLLEARMQQAEALGREPSSGSSDARARAAFEPQQAPGGGSGGGQGSTPNPSPAQAPLRSMGLDGFKTGRVTPGTSKR